jgi:putative proteasome-type protease
MFRAARLAGRAVRQVYEVDGVALKAQDIGFDVSLLVGGQIAGRELRLFNVYAAGNFIEATEDTPFLQIGEHKYGKPILDRVATYDTDLYDAARLSLISMDSTIRSNLTVGPPFDMMVYRRDTAEPETKLRLDEDDPYLQMIRSQWSQSLRDAYLALPDPPWAKRANGNGKIKAAE